MTKKILAALTALALCVGTAGCGSVEESGGQKAPDGAAYGETTSQEDAAADDTVSPDEGEEIPDKTAEELSGIDPKHIISTLEDVNDTPTAEELAQFAALAMEQYRAANEGDAQRYLDLIGLDSLGRVLADYMPELSEMGLYAGLNDMEKPAKCDVLSDALWRLLMLADGEKASEIGLLDYNGQDIYPELQAAIDSIDLSDDQTMEMLTDKTAYGDIQSLEPWDGGDENTVVAMKVYSCDRDGDDLYIYFDMVVYSGDVRYILYIINAMRVNGAWGVSIGSAWTKENHFAGMTADEIIAEAERYRSPDYAAKVAYNSLAEFIADSITLGLDPQEAIREDMPAATSAEGLDLAAGVPAAEGDKILYDVLTGSGFAEGVVKIGEYLPDLDTAAVFFTSSDGTEGQFPEGSYNKEFWEVTE